MTVQADHCYCIFQNITTFTTFFSETIIQGTLRVMSKNSKRLTQEWTIHKANVKLFCVPPDNFNIHTTQFENLALFHMSMYI
jgi:hypothetical protein